MAALIDTVARPYAKAIFNVAKSQDRLELWAERLQQAAAWVVDPQIVPLLHDPKVAPMTLFQLFIDLFVEPLDENGQQFIGLLVQYKRLAALPQIAAAYNQFVADHQARVEVCIVSAFELTAKQSQQLNVALKKRLQREVNLKFELDETLMGGAVIRIGDRVIDGSLRGKLNRLRSELEETRL